MSLIRLNNFRTNMTKYMKHNGVSDGQLSRSIGISQCAVTNLRNGKTQPKLGNAIKISDALGVSLDTMLKINNP